MLDKTNLIPDFKLYEVMRSFAKVVVEAENSPKESVTHAYNGKEYGFTPYTTPETFIQDVRQALLDSGGDAATVNVEADKHMRAAKENRGAFENCLESARASYKHSHRNWTDRQLPAGQSTAALR